MVRVFRCHPFASQNVFISENEPLKVFSTESLAFIATDQCYIEVHSLTQPGCPLVHKFPTVAPVMELVYSEADNFIATLEDKPSMSGSQTAVRVYLNWRSDLSNQPMRASIAGYMTSLRQVDDSSRFEVVEIPLKGSPNCISVDKTFGAIAVAIGQNLLVYGFCTKVVADTKTKHKDIKCLLDLEFSFNIQQIAVAEDYIAVCSYSEVQVVMLKTPICPGPELTDCPMKQRNSSVNLSDKGNPPSNSNHNNTAKEFLAFENRSNYTPSPSLNSQSSGTTTCGNIVHFGKKTDDFIIEDEHFVNWSFHDPEDTIAVPTPQKSTKISTVAAASANALRTIVLKGIATVQRKKAKTVRLTNNGELLGPVDNPIDCPVTVEYEDVCNPTCTKRGHVTTGVRTCLYRKFDLDSSRLHSLQLIPVYLPASHTRRKKEGRKCCVFCPIEDHDSLVGMTLFVSDEDIGYLYNVHGNARQLSSYPYAKKAKCVSVSDQLLYVTTSRGLEVYTSRSILHALHNVSPVDGITNALPSSDLEPCLIGIQPFFGAEYVQASDTMVLLLTKLVSSSKTKNNDANWSFYALRRQKVHDLYRDMMDITEQYQLTSPPTHLQLLQEAQLLLRTHQFKYGTNESSIHNLIKESASHLASHYACHDEEDWSLARPYFLISGLSVREVIQSVKRSRHAAGLSDVHGRGLMIYLDYMLFRQENALHCPQNEADLILEIYAQMEPSSLSSAILRSTLTSYSNEKALELLKTWRKISHGPNRANLDVLSLAVLYMRTGQLHDAEACLFSLTPAELLSTCTSNPWLLHEEYSQFSHLSQMLRKHQRKHFIQILIALLEKNIFQIDSTIRMLQGNSDMSLHENLHVREYLEGIVVDSDRDVFFPDAIRRLVDIYIGSLKDWRAPSSLPKATLTVRDIIPKGTGIFAKRFAWLDQFPPFDGPRFLTRPCNSLLALRSEQAKATCGSDGTKSGKLREACGCCSCNAELLKLQSLLCSNFIPRETLYQLLSELDASRNMRGVASLKVLCQSRLNPKDALSHVINEFPQCLAYFVKEMLDSDSNETMWKHIVMLLVERLHSPLDEKDRLKYEQAFKDVLTYMAEVLSPAELISFLPGEGSTALYLPYLERSYEKQRSHKLKAIIIERVKAFELRPS